MTDALSALWQAFSHAVLAHPVWSVAAGLVAVAAVFLSRRPAMIAIAGFLAVAAIVGLEPVEAATLRTLFALGCLSSLLAIAFIARR